MLCCLARAVLLLSTHVVKPIVHNLNITLNRYRHNLLAQLGSSLHVYEQSTNLKTAFNIRRYSSYFEPYHDMADTKFAADYAKRVAGCKKCKQKIEKGELRLAKVVPNYFNDGDGEMKQYHHAKCLFETFIKARATTKIIEEADDIQDFTTLTTEDKDLLNQLIKETLEKKGSPKKTPAKKPAAQKSPASENLEKKGSPKTTPAKKPAAQKSPASAPSPSAKATTSTTPSGKNKTLSSKETKPAAPVTASSTQPAPVNHLQDVNTEKDNSFREFRRLCAEIADVPGYNDKTMLIRTFIQKGSTGDGFKGDVYLVMKLLLPGVVKIIYNMNNKQLVKIFSQIFGSDLDEMVEDLEQGDVAETIRQFFEKSTAFPPPRKSTLSIQEVDKMLTDLSEFTKEDDQLRQLKKISKKCTANDLKMIVRLIKHDLRINSGAKHILDALDPNAYMAFKASRNLRDVVDRVNELSSEDRPGMKKTLSIKAMLLTPVQPMLAEACKSVEQAFKKCPNGMYAEIKYDGERVQVHKKGSDFHFYSRSLKPVQNHKIQHFKEYIPKAFPHGNDLILDSEVLLIDTATSKPLPFGSLGVHKKEAFKDAQVGLFVFDCLHYNGESLMNKPLKERRKIMHKVMVEIPHRVLFSEMEHITEKKHLNDMMMRVFREGLEGLVLKDVDSLYEPGKRHWLKVKKDYVADGAMADTADLVVLGAYFGTGNKGGIMSIFLMGVHDTQTDKWCTVTKCGSGFDDKTLANLQKELKMIKISKDFSKIPGWLKINKNLTPDFVVEDPKKSPVWEITGAEFSKSDAHTANGVSIRFPRCTKMREDKTWKEATNLSQLLELFKISKQHSDIPDVLGASTSRAPEQTKQVNDEDSDACSSPSDITESVTPVATPRKRKLSSAHDDEPSPKSKKNYESSRPLCKYGPSCYQKNPEHRRTFSHSQKKASQHLPDVFSGMKFHLPTDTQKYDQLYRYILAFDGDVVADFDKDSATHEIVDVKGDSSSDKQVPVKWVWECIKKKSLVPIT